MVSDKAIHKAFRIHKTLWTKPTREIFYFHYLPKPYIGFNTLLKSDVTRRDHVSVVMDPMNAGSRIINFIRDSTVFA